jgi:hypothetical protein
VGRSAITEQCCLLDDPADVVECVVGVLAQSDERHVGPFLSRHLADFFDVERAGDDDGVSHLRDDAGDAFEAVSAFVRDQDRKM